MRINFSALQASRVSNRRVPRPHRAVAQTVSRGVGRRLATKGTKSTKGRSRSVFLPFVLFVPFVANLLPSPWVISIPASGVRFGQQPLTAGATFSGQFGP